jgi:tetratricopeptide (TPR) repeat protein
MGARAVVAAGWAVDDSAALTFATAFYDQMLRGRPFGEAVKTARVEAFDRHPGTNTWGAYQCYGNPDYRLIKEKDARSEEETFRWVTPSQAVAELNNVMSRLATMAAQGAEPEKKRLKAIAAWLKEKKWLGDGRVCAALGRAFGEAKLFEEAIEYYKSAVVAENAQATIRDIEQLANFESRHAVALAGRGKPDAALATIDRAIGRLRTIGGPRLAKTQTVERLSLLGSACKRRALISAPDRSKSLEKMRLYYQTASDLAFEKKKRVDPYPLLNRLTAELAVAWQNGQKGIPQAQIDPFNKGLSASRIELESAQMKAPEVWGKIGLVDIDLLAALAESRLDEEAVKRIVEGYREARKLASPREFESVFDQFDFLKVMAGKNPKVVQFMSSIRQQLETAPGRKGSKPA